VIVAEDICQLIIAVSGIVPLAHIGSLEEGLLKFIEKVLGFES
jgi:hypothetical protein